MDNCPNDYNYTGNDFICLKKCSSKYGEYFEKFNNSYKCLKTCNKLIVNDTKECVSNCPPDYYESPNNICYKSCKLDIEYPFSTINFNGSKKICSKKCNDSEPNYGEDKICTSSCPDPNLQIIDYDGKCVSSCENPYYKYQHNKTCVYKCPKYINKNKECVDECVGDFNYIEDNECKKSCEEPSYFAEKNGNMFECKTKCEYDKYY